MDKGEMINCPLCGHPAYEHHEMGCWHQTSTADCDCYLNKEHVTTRAVETLQAALAVARAVIAEFVYPQAPMTPAQRAAWEAWQNLQKE